MNGENIKKRESQLAKAYKEGHYGEDLQKMLKKRKNVFKNLANSLSSFFL